MGYTHYWYRKPKLDGPNFAKVSKDFMSILPSLGCEIAGSDGSGSPDITNDLIMFNGVGKYAHETFMLELESNSINDKLKFEFCKTARKPYDMAVQVCLLIAKYHFKNEFEVSSDGDMEDWEEAILLCEKHFKHPFKFEFGRSDE